MHSHDCFAISVARDQEGHYYVFPQGQLPRGIGPENVEKNLRLVCHGKRHPHFHREGMLPSWMTLDQVIRDLELEAKRKFCMLAPD
jgi:hypothetical protein